MRTVSRGGLFQNGASAGVRYADFDQSYDPINGLTYQQSPNAYTVQAGDTLQSIAQAIWGDSNFWYVCSPRATGWTTPPRWSSAKR